MIWDDVMTEEDKAIFAKGGYGKRYELGIKPALLLIDFTYEFTGWSAKPVLESQDEFRTACGENAWNAVESSAKLLKTARLQGVPVIFTRMDKSLQFGPFNTKKNLGEAPKRLTDEDKATQVVDELKPLEGEIVISKIAPSAFWGTPMISFLIRNRIDTLIVGGGTTSGCVRASVIDAFSLGYKICVVEECVFDRGSLSHKVNLWDMNAKQANVVNLSEVTSYIEAL